MKLHKCPACKNIVSMDSYCCPRCGIDFRARRIRRFVTWICLLGVAAWVFHKHFLR